MAPCHLESQDSPEIAGWLSCPFYGVVCRVSDAELNQAKELDDHVVLSESALKNQEVAIAFRPREECH